MTLDKEEHRALLLQLVNQTAFPGQFAEDIVALKQSILLATVAPEGAHLSPENLSQHGFPMMADNPSGSFR